MESADPRPAEELSESSLDDMLDAMDEPELPFDPPLPVEAADTELPFADTVPESPAAEPVAVAESVDTPEPVDAGEPLAASHSGVFAAVALAIVLVLLLAAVAWLVNDTRNARSSDDARQAALQAARQEAVNLTTISYQTADADLGRIINAATGTLKTQFEAQRAQFPGVLQRDKSVSVGTVLAAGVASQSASTAEALVAVDASVSNDQSAKTGGPIVKHYRMDMKLVRIGSRWLVSQVAFAGLPQ